MTLKSRLKTVWDNSLLRAYLKLEWGDVSSLKIRLKYAWAISLFGGFILFVFLYYFFLSKDFGAGEFLLCMLSAFVFYCLVMHFLVLLIAPQTNNLIITEEHPIDFGKYTHITKYKKPEDPDLDKYLCRYFEARQYSIYAVMAIAFISALMFLLFLFVASGA